MLPLMTSAFNFDSEISTIEENAAQLTTQFYAHGPHGNRFPQ